MLKKVYMVGQLRKSVEFVDMETKQRGVMPLMWVPGMVGVFPVFDSLESAEKYNHGMGEYPIVDWDVEEPSVH